MNIFKLIFWVLRPEKAIDNAQNLLCDIKDKKGDLLDKIREIGYMNEFFFKYLTWGKSNKYAIELSSDIDKQKYSDDPIKNTLIKLRVIRLTAKKYYDAEKYSETKNKIIGVSQGSVQGLILNIKNQNQKIKKGTIGVFPNASTKYTNLFYKCSGIIFLKGSITSHGAIVAREFKIPAIVYPSLKIADKTSVKIDGDTASLTLL